MANLKFPTSIRKPSYGSTVDYEDISIRSKMENGVVKARRKFTKSRKTWLLRWDSLPEADYLILMRFLANECYFSAVPFEWECFADGKTYLVRFADKEKFETKAVGYYSGSITLQEC